MVDIAQEAIRSRNFTLATEVYERIIREKGPASDLYIQLGNCLALSGRISESFASFLKAYRLACVKPDQLNKLVNALVKITKERMETANGGKHNKLLMECKDILDNEPFYCGLCLGTIVEPVTIYCGHTFCRKCVDKSGYDNCVACGAIPHIMEYKQNVLLADIMKTLFPRMDSLLSLKQQANDKFLSGHYLEAVELYTQILSIAPAEHLIYSNRSLAYMKMEEYHKAYEDAVTAIKLRPQWSKGYFRRGTAEESLNKSQEAAISYMKCLALQDTVQPAHDNLTQILHNLFKPNVSLENLKHVPSTSKEPMSQLMQSANSESGIQEGLEKLKALLDEQFKECDTVLNFTSQIDKVEHSGLTADKFECGVCYRLLYQPITTPCGHSFCLPCLNRSMDHSIDCPQCRGSLACYLALRHHSVTQSLQRMIALWFPNELRVRENQHEEEMATFNTAGNTAEIPIFVCTLAYPTIPCPLHIFEPRYRLMMRQVMESGVRQFGMCSYSNEDGHFSDYGTMLEISDIQFFSDGRSVVDTVGGRRFRVLERGMRDGYHTAKVEFLEDTKPSDNELNEVQRLYDETYDITKNWLTDLPTRLSSRIMQQFGHMPEKDQDFQSSRLGPKWTWWVLAILPIDPRAQLALLSMNSLTDRLKAIHRVLSHIQRRT